MLLEVLVCTGVTGVSESVDVEEKAQIAYPKWVRPAYVNKIRGLTCYEAVREMLMRGIPSVEVAKSIHNMGEMLTCNQDSLRVMVEHFKATLPKALMIAKMDPTQYLQTKAKVEQTIDVMEELAWLYKQMKKRIQIQVKREEAVGFLLAGGEKQFSVAVDMMAKIHDIVEKQLGVTNAQAVEAVEKFAHSTNVDWSKAYSKPAINEVMADPKARMRVVKFTETMATIFGKMDPDKQNAVIAAAKKKVRDENQERSIVVESSSSV